MHNQGESEGATKMSLRQKEIMVEFMEDHPDFAKGKLLGNDGKHSRKAIWGILTTQLNSVNGPKKTSKKWQRVWVDLKNKVKKKASTIKRSISQTGGGPGLNLVLNDMEGRIVHLIGEVAVYGLQSTQEAPLDSEDVNQPASVVEAIDDPDQPSTSGVIWNRPSSSDTMRPSSSDTMSPVEADAFEDHNYYYSVPVGKGKRKKMRPSTSSASETVPLPPTSSSDEASPRRPRVPPPTSAASAAVRFAEIGETLNRRMKSIDAKLETLVKGRQETNEILKNLVTAVKNLKK